MARGLHRPRVMTHAAVILSLVLALTCAGAAEDTARPSQEAAEPERPREPMTTLRLDVPPHVSNASSTPILVLEGVEIGAGEGMTIEVLGPPDPESNARATLAVSGLVGARQSELAEPREQMNLVIPLNETATDLLARKSEITLALRLKDSPGRESLQIARAYFR